MKLWTKDKPDVQGWYFWRKRKNQSDPWKWDAIFVMGGKEITYWSTGVEIHEPVGGYWSLIE